MNDDEAKAELLKVAYMAIGAHIARQDWRNADHSGALNKREEARFRYQGMSEALSDAIAALPAEALHLVRIK